jgi:hypothetical protein
MGALVPTPVPTFKQPAAIASATFFPPHPQRPRTMADQFREVDGLKIAFVHSESYFSGMLTPSMYSTHKATGADVVILLAEGKTYADVSDDAVREILSDSKGARNDN